jgi:hypothetical protein
MAIQPNNSENKEKLNTAADYVARRSAIMFFSIISFFIAVLAYSIYSIRSGSKPFTVKYLFFTLATAFLCVTFVMVVKWVRF